MHEPTHLDLFSGIGGFALAAGWAGFRTIAFSEIDTYASAVLKKHWPDVPNLGDIRSLDGKRYSGVSLVTAGVPCQPASCAGHQRGDADDRWLWPEALRILGAAKPTFAVFENPPGILALSGGLAFERLLSEMESHGYEVQPIIIPACAVSASHRRDRLWIVAHTNESHCGRGPDESQRKEEGREIISRDCEDVGDTNGRVANKERRTAPRESRHASKPDGRCGGSSAVQHWPTEPAVDRVAYGIPNRVDRLRGLGNAIVPQVAYQILKAIREQL